jgi:hypothetical protein
MTAFLTKIRKPNRTKRLLKKIRSFFYLEQWILLLGKNIPDTNPSWDDFTRITPPPDRIWADPFIWTSENNYYVFFEEQPLDTKRGRICCLTLNKNLEIIINQPVLERPYHLSYPFLFEYEDRLFMLPETGENRTIEVYSCIRFPDQWEKIKTLISDISAYDATLLQANGKWWLFANITSEESSTWDSLHLFYANHPLSENWTPHPLNPIVQDIRSARPAGRIFSNAEGVIRPSQDCSVRYGFAINFNKIERLSETEYKETLIRKFQPTGKNILATHTWNRKDDLLAIDAFWLRNKFFK